MKKPRKTAAKNVESKRMATYLTDDIIAWIKEESKKIDRKESAFIRMVLKEKMQSQTKGA